MSARLFLPVRRMPLDSHNPHIFLVDGNPIPFMKPIITRQTSSDLDISHDSSKPQKVRRYISQVQSPRTIRYKHAKCFTIFITQHNIHKVSYNKTLTGVALSFYCSTMVFIPKSSKTVDVQLINTTASIIVGALGFVQPILPGHELLHLPTFCFLIRHKASKRTVLFDCGARKDWRQALAPSIVDVVAQAEIRVEKNVDEILIDGGVDLEDINSIIWRYQHHL